MINQVSCTDNLIKGLQILKKYDKNAYINTESGKVLFGTDDMKVTREDLEILKKIGWFISEVYDCWVFYTL